MLRDNILITLPIFAAFLLVGMFMLQDQPISSGKIRSTLNMVETAPLLNNDRPQSAPQMEENTQVDIASNSVSSQPGPDQKESRPHGKIEMSTDDCSCPEGFTTSPCSVSGEAVLGGLDFVQYFTDFKNEDGTYDESKVGVAGDSSVTSTYAGFKYYFLSEENKALFDASPESYIPQWGGFCSYGVSEEGCPKYAWSADCLGPSGNYGHWTIQNEKLYFFLFSAAKTKFMAAVDQSIADGDARWDSWFGSDTYAHMSTSCYVSSVGDDE